MIAVDTNVLVYAHREDSEWHAPAFARVKALAESGLDWAIPWPCLHEFLAVVTHPKIYRPPTPLDAALAQVDAWLESPTLRLLGEASSHWETLKELLAVGKVRGPVVHDARVAALCRESGVSKLWTADRDFSRFRSLRTENPLLSTNP